MTYSSHPDRPSVYSCDDCGRHFKSEGAVRRHACAGGQGRNLERWQRIEQLAKARSLRSDGTPAESALHKLDLLQSIIEEAEAAQAELVARARLAGSSWTVIGQATGRSKQGAQQRWSQRKAVEAIDPAQLELSELS